MFCFLFIFFPRYVLLASGLPIASAGARDVEIEKNFRLLCGARLLVGEVTRLRLGTNTASIHFDDGEPSSALPQRRVASPQCHQTPQACQRVERPAPPAPEPKPLDARHPRFPPWYITVVTQLCHFHYFPYTQKYLNSLDTSRDVATRGKTTVTQSTQCRETSRVLSRRREYCYISVREERRAKPGTRVL